MRVRIKGRSNFMGLLSSDALTSS
ncbi:hypothetical protein RHECNPAF_12600118 [Rhizobium etli CNPAF512]|nr:hypothetical protein RHECNPAF_12600118 [Rhizobium etli CNPAF512]